MALRGEWNDEKPDDNFNQLQHISCLFVKGVSVSNGVILMAVLLLAYGVSRITRKTFSYKRATFASLAMAMTVGIAVAPMAGASTLTQKALKISNATLTSSTTASVKVTTSGGSGTGRVTFAVSGAGCSIGSTSGVLTANASASCVVKATKAASGSYKSATSTPVTFTFTAPSTTPSTPTTPTPVTSDGATPAQPDVATLTSVTGAASAQVNDTTNGDSYFIDQYYNANDHWYIYYIKPGATITVNWHVNGSNGQPLANAAVTLIGNADYSCAPGVQWTTTSLDANPGCNGGQQGTLSGTTDASGNVSFTLTDKDPANSNNPGDVSSVGAVTQNEATGSPFAWTDLFLQVGSDIFTASPNTTVNQGTDRVDIIVADPGNATPVTPPVARSGTESPSFATPDAATLIGLTGTTSSMLNGTADGNGGGSGWIPTYYHLGDRWLLNYVAAGSTVSMTWYVSGSYGQPLANQAVTLVGNIAYTGSCGVVWATSSLNVDNNCNTSGTTQGVLAGTTNANGLVTFTLQDTNASAACTMSQAQSQAEAQEGYNPDASSLYTTWPCNFTTMELVIGSDNPSAGSSSNMTTDRIDFLLTPPSTANEAPTFFAPDHTNVTAITGAAGTGLNTLDATNTKFATNNGGSPITRYWHSGDTNTTEYVHSGSTISLTYHVTGSNGQVLANTAVTLIDNQAGVCDTGIRWTSGTTGSVTTTFTSTSGLNKNDACSYADAGGEMTGTTDANGNVTFTLVAATQSTSCTVQSSATAAVAQEVTGCAWTRMFLTIGPDPWSGSNTDTYDADNWVASPPTNLIMDVTDIQLIS